MTSEAAAAAYKKGDLIQPYKGDPFLGNLATPINSSPIVKAFINNLPAYRKGLSPFTRGLEIGAAHGYWLVGPEVLLGPLRETSHGAAVGGLITAIALIAFASLGMTAFGLATFQGDPKGAYNSKSTDAIRPIRSKDDWFQLSSGVFLGAMGGAVFAFLLLENFGVIDDIFQGAVNVSQIVITRVIG